MEAVGEVGEELQVAISQVVRRRRASDPEEIRFIQANMLDGMEVRRAAEERRTGKRLRLEHLGFKWHHEGRVLECRAYLVDEPAAEDEVLRPLADGGERVVYQGGYKPQSKRWPLPDPPLTPELEAMLVEPATVPG